MHNRIMTNFERARRHLTSNAFCVFCAGEHEDNNHLFRNCPEANGIWTTVLQPSVTTTLAGLDWESWLIGNVRGDTSLGLTPDWPPRFAIRMWWIWKWRNDAIFNGRMTPLDQKLRWLSKKEVEIAAAFAA